MDASWSFLSQLHLSHKLMGPPAQPSQSIILELALSLVRETSIIPTRPTHSSSCYRCQLPLLQQSPAEATFHPALVNNYGCYNAQPDPSPDPVLIYADRCCRLVQPGPPQPWFLDSAEVQPSRGVPTAHVILGIPHSFTKIMPNFFNPTRAPHSIPGPQKNHE